MLPLKERENHHRIFKMRMVLPVMATRGISSADSSKTGKSLSKSHYGHDLTSILIVVG